jgi:serine/threonine-protein kinase
MSEVADPRVGKILDNRYTITRRIADGGMASVYQANDSRLERTVAIKIIHAQLAQGPHRDQFLHRFHAEAKSAAAIANPHIVQVYDTGEFDDLQYIVMEYVHGVNLRQAMERNPTFSVRDTLRILSETLDGLSSAHQAGLVHRDIKPENILINSRGHVEITDFGLAKAVTDATMGTTGLLLGTAAYLAPEMIEDNRATPQADLYSVGIMGYEMLSGTVPFTSDNPITMVFKHVHDDVPSLASVSTDFPESLVSFISRLSSRDPAQRPTDASAALEELRAAASSIDREQLFFTYAPRAVAGAQAASDGQALKGAQPSNGTQPNLDAATGNPDATAAIAPLPTTQDSPTQQLLHSQSAPVVQSAEKHTGHTSVIGDSHSGSSTPPTPPTASALGAAAKASTGASKTVSKAKNRKKTIVISVVSAVVALLAGLIVWWWFWGPGSYWVVPEAADKPCAQQSSSCTLEGASYSEYKKTLSVLGIDYSATQAYSDTVAAGSIISSSPKVNGHVTKRGGKLSLKISKGVKNVTIPADILDCSTYPKAQEALTKLGFTNLEVKEEYSLDVAEGCAISSNVEPGTTVKHNDSVGLVVSKGPKPVEIPSKLAGVTQKEAETQLAELKLDVTVEEEYSDSIAKGSVIGTDPAEGQPLHWGDEVTLTVSKGPQTAVVPNLVGMGKDEAVKKLEALGFKVKTQSSALGETLHLVLKQSADGGKALRLRDTSGNPTVITLTVV